MGALLVVILCGITFASAASLSVTTDGLASAQATVPQCTTTGAQVIELTTASATVGSVYVANLDSACAGATLQLTVYSGAGSSVSASATVPTSGGFVLVPLSPAPAMVVGSEVDLVVVGP